MKIQAITEYLNDPIPRKQAIVGVMIANSGVVGMYLVCKSLLKGADKERADMQERLHVYHESLDFLLDRADNDTLRGLNKNLDYWRVVRGIPPRPEHDAD